MPALIMLSPRTASTKSASRQNWSGRGRYSSTWSSATTGEPAATWPTSGSTVAPTGAAGTASTTGARRERPPSITSSARGLVASRRMSPRLSSFARCACTVDGEVRPTAWPISRTVGGYPLASTWVFTKSRISFCRWDRSIAALLGSNVCSDHSVAEGSDGVKIRGEGCWDPTCEARTVPQANAGGARAAPIGHCAGALTICSARMRLASSLGDKAKFGDVSVVVPVGEPALLGQWKHLCDAYLGLRRLCGSLPSLTAEDPAECGALDIEVHRLPFQRRLREYPPRHPEVTGEGCDVLGSFRDVGGQHIPALPSKHRLSDRDPWSV